MARDPYERIQPSLPTPFYALIQAIAEECNEQPGDLYRDLMKRGIASYLRDMGTALDLMGVTERIREVLQQENLEDIEDDGIRQNSR